MKKILQLFFIATTPVLMAQDVEKELIIEDGYKVKEHGFTTEGNLYLLINKRTLSAESKNASFTKYNNETLAEDYVLRPKEQFRIEDISPFGDKILYANNKAISFTEKQFNVVDDKGTVHDFEGKHWIPKDFNVVDDFINTDYYLAIGFEKEEEKIKKGTNRKYKLFRRDLNTFDDLFVDFKLPEIKSEDEREIQYQVIEYNATEFILLAKKFSGGDEKGENHRQQDYILISYDYEGNLKNQKSLNTSITDPLMSFSLSSTGPLAYKYVTKSYSKDGEIRYRTIALPQPSASGGIFNDKLNQEYYTFTVLKSKKYKKGSVFQVDKFKYNGEKQWSKEMALTSKNKKGKGFESKPGQLKLVNLEDKIGFALIDNGNDYMTIISLDKETGQEKVLTEYSNFKRFIPGAGIGNTDNLYSNEILSLYQFKDNFPKKYTLDYDTVIAYAFNEEFKKYMDSFSETKRRLHFISSINENGIITINANNKDNIFRLLKFNWKDDGSVLSSKAK